jgi:aminoglycoside/choline kinase family phosphotransferase
MLLAQDLDAGFLLLEDLGGPTLARILDERNADEWFGRSIEQLLRLQAIPVPADFASLAKRCCSAMPACSTNGSCSAI